MDVRIVGGREELAEAILVMATKHSISASYILETKENLVLESEIVEASLNCFYTELSFLST